MAITSLRDQLVRLVTNELNASRRYRCLILQTDRLDIQSKICDFLPDVMSGLGIQSVVLSWESYFDSVGAISADSTRTKMLTAGKEKAIILSGPLHFVDYWTAGVQEAFWNFLSLYSRGPGIVVVDIHRTEGVEGPFVARGVVTGTDIRFLRPRLVAMGESFT
jgi:hypothetical protein